MSRTVRLLAVAVLALAVVTASGAFTATSADRGAAVSVVGDDRMLLGVETRAPELANGRNDDVELLAVTNQLPGAVLTTVRANVTAPDPRPPRVRPGSVTTPEALSVGESGAVTADVVCAGGSSATGRLVVAVTVAGDGVRFSATRDVTVACAGPPGRSPNGGAPGSGSSAASDGHGSDAASDGHGSNATAGGAVRTETEEGHSRER